MSTLHGWAPNNNMQRTAPRAAADAERYAKSGTLNTKLYHNTYIGERLMARLSALFALLIITSLSQAEETPLWKTVGGWQIRVDTTLGNGCFTYQIYEGNTVFRIGVNKLAGGVYVIFGDSDWKSLEAGKQYPVKLYFGDETPWVGDATALEFSGLPALMLQNTSKDSAANLLTEFMHKTSVKIEYKNKIIANLSLNGTYKAGLEVLECQKVFNEAEDKADPFENHNNPSDDPFAI